MGDIEAEVFGVPFHRRSLSKYLLVDNRKQSAVINAGSRPKSFEDIMESVRRKLLEERNAATSGCRPTIEGDADES